MMVKKIDNVTKITTISKAEIKTMGIMKLMSSDILIPIKSLNECNKKAI